MKKNLLFLMLALGFSGQAVSNVIGFDDVNTINYETISNNYHGFQWNNFYLQNANALFNSGYYNGKVSPVNVAYNGYGEAASIQSTHTFTFDGAYFTAAWNNGLSIEIKGFNGADLLYDTIFTVNTYSPVYQALNFANITSLDFLSFGGLNAGYSGIGTHFAMDNFAYHSAVPIPGAVWLFGSALVGMLGLKRKAV